MNDRDALLAAIYGNPEDDAPRLVFADWLDEHGEPERAEFIRIQVEMRRECERNKHVSERHERLFVRSREVLYQPWAESVRTLFGRGVGAYSRGFPVVTELHRTAEILCAHLDRVETWLPPEFVLTVTWPAGRLGRLATVTTLRRVRQLTLHQETQDEHKVSNAEVIALMNSPHLTRVSDLVLRGLGLSDKTGRAFPGLRGLQSLETLDLGYNSIGPAGAQALAAAPVLARLRRLDLTENPVGDDGVRALLDSPHLTGLSELLVYRTDLSLPTRRRLNRRFPSGRSRG